MTTDDLTPEVGPPLPDDPQWRDRAPRICLDCSVHYPFLWSRCPHCASTRYLNQETGVEHGSAIEAAS